MAAIDVVNRVFREFRRYTGDGLPGEPVNAPLPIGDPSTGVHSPKKSEIRSALLASTTEAEDAAGRAQGYAALLSVDRIRFGTVAALLSDEIMSYTGGVDLIEVGEGDIIEAGGFRYAVASSAATDEHVETEGGVKLYVFASMDGRMPAGAFGAVGDGATDSYAAIKAALVAGKGKILLPAGRVMISYPLHGDSLDIEGAGYENTFSAGRIGTELIKTTNNLPDVDLGTINVTGNDISLNVDAVIINDYYYHFTLKNLTLLQQAPSKVAFGVFAPYVALGIFENLRIGEDSQTTNFVCGFRCLFGWKITLTNIFVSGSEYGLDFPSQAAPADVGYNSIILDRAWIKFTTKAAIRIKGCTGLILKNPYPENFSGRGLDLDNCPQIELSSVALENGAINAETDALIRMRRCRGVINGLEMLFYTSTATGTTTIRDLIRLEANCALTINSMRDGGADGSDAFVGNYRYFNVLEGTSAVNLTSNGSFFIKGVPNTAELILKHTSSLFSAEQGGKFRTTLSTSLNSGSTGTDQHMFRILKPASGTVQYSADVTLLYSKPDSGVAGLFRYLLAISCTSTTVTIVKQTAISQVSSGSAPTFNFGFSDAGAYFNIDVEDATLTFSGAFIDATVYSRTSADLPRLLPAA